MVFRLTGNVYYGEQQISSVSFREWYGAISFACEMF
jgi:hypothetical protein